jgi:hypothetical protein
MAYVSTLTACFHNCSVDTWSIMWIDKISSILSCHGDERLHVYWCLLGKDITNGLVLVEKDAHL